MSLKVKDLQHRRMKKERKDQLDGKQQLELDLIWCDDGTREGQDRGQRETGREGQRQEHTQSQHTTDA